MRPRLPSRSFIHVLIIFSLLCGQLAFTYEGSSHSAIRQTIFQNPYDELPHYRVEKKLFGKSGRSENNHLLQAAKRTLTAKEDLLEFPQGQKLLQANGICFAGEWIIDTDSPYSGLFQNPTRSLVIARASVALSGTRQSDKRAFGFAIKLFPTNDADSVVPTLNAFVVHSMGGVRTKHVLDLALDNEPPLGAMPSFSQLGAAYRLLRDLKAADKMISKTKPDVSYRPVTHLAEYGADGEASAPRWLRLRAADGLPRVDKNDFRDELRVKNYPQQQLIWSIEVAVDKNSKKSNAEWQPIGRLVFNESITSPACDKQLHFAHPLLR
ncbi:MAG: hypothetical protein ACR2P1_16790 [Pseudomonadales bacterium]